MINYQEFLEYCEKKIELYDECARNCKGNSVDYQQYALMMLVLGDMRLELIRNHDAFEGARKLKRMRPCYHCKKLISKPEGTHSSQGKRKVDWICKECF